jgi:hypothetical protein
MAVSWTREPSSTGNLLYIIDIHAEAQIASPFLDDFHIGQSPVVGPLPAVTAGHDSLANDPTTNALFHAKLRPAMPTKTVTNLNKHNQHQY